MVLFNDADTHQTKKVKNLKNLNQPVFKSQ